MMMTLRSVKLTLYYFGITLAAASMLLHFAPQLVDAEKSVNIGYFGMWLSGGIMVLWVVLEVLPAGRKEEKISESDDLLAPHQPIVNHPIEPDPLPVESPDNITDSRSANLQNQILVDDADEYGPEHGYKPQKYMFQCRDRIETFIARKLAKIDNAKPWIVSPPFASLSSVTVDINPKDRSSLLLNTDFKNELLTKLPEGAELRPAAGAYKYPRVVFPRQSREFIPTAEALAAMKRTDNVLIGYDEDMQLIAVDIVEARHLMILGKSGSGKGIGLHNVVLSLLSRFSPQQMQLVFIEPKIGEYAQYKNIPHLLGRASRDIDRTLEYLTWLVDETDRRQQLFDEHDLNNIIDFNELHKAKALPRITLIFDELTKFYKFIETTAEKPKKVKDELDSKLTILAVAARSAGIHLVISTQNSKGIMPPELLSELNGRLYFQIKKQTLQSAESDDGELKLANQLKDKGDGLWFYDGTMKRVQAPSIFSPAKELPALITQVTHQYKDYTRAEFIQPDPEPEIDAGLASDDEIYLSAVEYVAIQKKLVQRDIEREFGIGGSRCKKLIDAMEANGFIGPKVGRGQRRSVLITPAKLRQKYGEASAKLPENVIEFSRSEPA